jgi:hypothetical protein
MAKFQEGDRVRVRATGEIGTVFSIVPSLGPVVTYSVKQDSSGNFTTYIEPMLEAAHIEADKNKADNK